MGIIKKKLQQMLLRIWGERNPHTLLVGIKIHATFMDISLEVHQKTKNRTIL
jgi:ABC-type taurine transport system ATPase subunit